MEASDLKEATAEIRTGKPTRGGYRARRHTHYTCSFCGVVFASSQGLAGHAHCHYPHGKKRYLWEPHPKSCSSNIIMNQAEAPCHPVQKGHSRPESPLLDPPLVALGTLAMAPPAASEISPPPTSQVASVSLMMAPLPVPRAHAPPRGAFPWARYRPKRSHLKGIASRYLRANAPRYSLPPVMRTFVRDDVVPRPTSEVASHGIQTPQKP